MELTLPPHSRDHMLGNPKGDITLVEYGDYECPLTARSLSWTEHILQDFPGEICFLFRHYPLTEIHPDTALAAAAAELAGLYGKFWLMHRILLENSHQLKPSRIMKFLKDLELPPEKLYLQSILDKIEQDVLSAQQSGVTSTPGFFLNGLRLEGPVNLEVLRSYCFRILSGQRIYA